MPIYFNDREIVLPGQLLSDDSRRAGEGTYVMDGKVYAATVGAATIRDGKVEVITFRGPYKPAAGDMIIGVVSDIKPIGVEVDLGGHVTALLKVKNVKELASLDLKVGDVVYARVSSSGLKGVLLELNEQFKKINEGVLLRMTPTKIPRLIGKRGSMINMLKKITGCNIMVGTNGFVIVNGPSPAKEFAAISAIRLIEREAHSQGLTDKVMVYLSKLVGGEVSHDTGDKA
ncbi:MAG: exosome complex protein Rrp4 [Thaumarchaeota archaeon]|jgi:exosome complex component RRP4|nr:exosome complex protein Rrp4 [Candidatus Terraquivivens yellowstonensis]MCL7398006.1 exosome complex protein Rrp4 [Candidatus Terraquivivens yellowstonensis]MCL7400324.1 exosome complex protein Rrp4 [Candidatus Terraquivivens yellowstonensis]